MVERGKATRGGSSKIISERTGGENPFSTREGTQQQRRRVVTTAVRRVNFVECIDCTHYAPVASVQKRRAWQKHSYCIARIAKYNSLINPCSSPAPPPSSPSSATSLIPILLHRRAGKYCNFVSKIAIAYSHELVVPYLTYY